MKRKMMDIHIIQKDNNKLKSLYQELAELEAFNPYRKNTISDMPKGSGGKNFSEWYTEEKMRIENDIKYYQEKIQRDRAEMESIIESLNFPDCDIVRFRVINGMNWENIGNLMGMDRRTASRKFFSAISKLAHNARDNVI